jgi:hypothetical protein
MHRIDWQCDESDDRVVIQGADARMTFARLGDRWIHHLSFGRLDQHDDEPTELISTEESDPRGDDPARVVSPVYQELHRHEFASDFDRGVCLLLTGRQFHHHFSAAVTIAADPERKGAVIVDFDVADRCRADVASLAATYLVRLGSSDLRDADAQSISWTSAAINQGLLTLQAEADGILALGEAGRQAARVQALARIASGSFTHRLHYRWLWATTAEADRTR